MVGEQLGPFSIFQQRHCLDISISDDDVCEEPEESFSLSLSTGGQAVNISREIVTVYIEDAGEVECGKLYHIAGKFGKGFNFVIQRICGKSPN